MTVGKSIGCGARMVLEDRQAFSLPRGSSCREIVCIDGVIWVTFSGDPRDFLLRQGERLAAAGRGRAVISAVGPAALVLAGDDEPAARAVRHRLTRVRAA